MGSSYFDPLDYFHAWENEESTPRDRRHDKDFYDFFSAKYIDSDACRLTRASGTSAALALHAGTTSKMILSKL